MIAPDTELFSLHMQYKYPRKDRLKSRKAIQALFDHGKMVRVRDLCVWYQLQKEKQMLQCGVGASSKYFKKAVDRNRIKRLLREAYRLQQHLLKEYALHSNRSIFLFILYTGKELPLYADLFKKVELALQKLLNAVHANDTENS